MASLGQLLHPQRHARLLLNPLIQPRRLLATNSQSSSFAPQPQPSKPTHFKITLRRSAISLGDKIKNTLISLGIHRRNQTVYHRHTPEAAGKILRVKELVEVENVAEELVRTKEQQTLDRRPPRGYQIVGSKKDRMFHA